MEKSKRYHLQIPDRLFAEVEEIAKKRGVTVVEVLRQFIRLGLFVADKLENSKNTELLIREGESVTKLQLLL
jgi:hypothetical protein